jgi:hypothetical protein
MKINKTVPLSKCTSVGIRKEAESQWYEEITLVGEYAHPDHPADREWNVRLWSVEGPWFAFEINGDPVFESDSREFDSICDAYRIGKNWDQSNGFKYSVSQNFETFGDPCERKFSSKMEAEKYAAELAEGIATCFYERKGDTAIIPFYDSCDRGGYIGEIEFHSDLSDEAGAEKSDSGEEIPGELDWDSLVNRISDAAVEIRREKSDEQE